mgnify:CR=1 FL=1
MIYSLTMVFFLVTESANAEWVKITETDTAVHYVDRSSIRKVGNIRMVWELQNLKFAKRPPFWWQEQSLIELVWRRPKEAIFGPPQKKLSYRYRSEYDCKSATWRISFYSTHSGPMAGGSILKQIETDYDWAHVSPNTPAMKILNKVCR